MDKPKICEHLTKVRSPSRLAVIPGTAGCKECLESGDWWVHLRLCMTCGHVGCCDDSPNRHATAHFHQTQHPVIKSFEPGENWAWCFKDNLPLEEIPAYPQESPSRHLAAPAEGP